MTREDLIDLMARAHASVFAERADTTAAMSAALVAITNAGCAVVPASVTWEMETAARGADWPRQDIYGDFLDSSLDRASTDVWDLMIKAGRIDREAGRG